MEHFSKITSTIWNIADILRGGWKQHEYQDVIIPLMVLKRLDCILSDTKDKVREQYDQYKGKVNDLDPILKRTAKAEFYNVSPYDFNKLTEDPRNIAKNFKKYLSDYSENIREIFEKFEFAKQLERLEGGNMLFEIIQKVNHLDLHPREVDNHTMGLAFEELLRKFSEMSNETAGEHYTSRDIIKLMVEVVFKPDEEILKKPHVIKTVYDCACGTGGMLTVAKNYIKQNINEKAEIYLYGQELNSATYAMAKSDMLITGENPGFIKGGEKDHSKASTLSNDQFFGESFDYGLSNPPYGVDWKKDKDAVEKEYSRGYAGRFGAGLPRISDGQLLFTEHMISKMRPEKDGGSRMCIVHNGSPLFTGDAGSGESEIRRYILEKDLLETVIALPDQLFYNTGINTYLWFLTNRKSKEKEGKVQLIDARNFYHKLRKSLGSKRHEISNEDREEVVKIYSEYKNGKHSKIFKNTDFAYRQITIERPLKLSFDLSDENIMKLREALEIDLKKVINKVIKKNDKGGIDSLKIITAIVSLKGKKWTSRDKFVEEINKAFEKQGIKSSQKILKTIIDTLGERDENAEICKDKDENIESDNTLRDYENVPFDADIHKYFEKEVKPYIPDAWINETIKDEKDGQIGIVGYEIPFTRYFYKYEAPRDIEEIEGDIEKVENELLDLLKKL